MSDEARAADGIGKFVAGALDRDNPVLTAIGETFRAVHAGVEKRAAADERMIAPRSIEIVADAFEDGGFLPPDAVGKHARFPALRWTNVPPEATSLALIVEDVDVPFPQPLVHAVLFDIPPTRTSIAAGEIPTIGTDGLAPGDLAVGKGDGGIGYQPPTPLPGHGRHRYVFQLFAVLPNALPAPGATREDLISALRGRVLACGEIVGVAEHA